jgi:hypothetical protein
MAPADEAESTSVQKTPRRTKINPERLERKRATDRETQRAIRAKTKSYIEHLEATVQRYEQQSGDELTQSLASQVSSQHAEIVRLQAVVRNARKMLEAAMSGELETEDQAKLLESVSMPPPTEPASTKALPPTQTSSFASGQPITQSIMPGPHIPDSSMGDMRGTMMTARSSFENPLACGEENTNYFGLLNAKLSAIHTDSSFCPLTSPEEDEDIAVRAVFKGWQDVTQRHQLDPAWQVLQATDQGLFYRSGQVERVAVLRNMRSMLLYKINPYWHPSPKLPAYMMPGQEQVTLPHPSLVDFFAWPSLRSWLIKSNITYLPESAASVFASTLRFRWHYHPHDVYMTHKKTGQYLLSHAFKQSLEDLSSWMLDEKFFSLGPTLANFLPVADDRERSEGVAMFLDLRNHIGSPTALDLTGQSPDTQPEMAPMTSGHTIVPSNIDLDGYHAPMFGVGGVG